MHHLNTLWNGHNSSVHLFPCKVITTLLAISLKLYIVFLWLIYFIMWSLNLLITLTCVNLKKWTISELQVKFYLGQNEDCSPGDSTSDSSEKLLLRGNIGIVILVKRGYMQACTYFLSEIFFLSEEWLLPWKILELL